MQRDVPADYKKICLRWLEFPNGPQIGETFVVATCAVIGQTLAYRFKHLQSNDREDICSNLLIKYPDRLKKNRDSIPPMDDRAFLAFARTVLYRLTLDQLKYRKYQTWDSSVLELSVPDTSVPVQADARIIWKELPRLVAEFATARDRFGYGPTAIQLIIRLLMTGERVSIDMVQSWLGVSNPRHCIQFCVLMSRFYLWQFRQAYSDVVTEELHAQLQESAANIHVFRVTD